MTLTRRSFLAASGLGVATIATGLGTQLAAAQSPTGGDKLVTLFLNGGADGLTLVPPVGMSSYYDRRPNIAVARPNQNGGALPLTAASSNGRAVFPSGLDGIFGLHPDLAPIYPLWEKGQLALVVDAGLPNVTRSHFRAIPRVMRGSNDNARGGWLARIVQAKSASGNPVLRGVSSPGAARMMDSLSESSALITNLSNFGINGFDERSLATAALVAMHNKPDSVSVEGKAYLDNVDEILEAAKGRRNGYPNNALGRQFSEVATLFEANLGIEAAALNYGGWDFHRNSNARTGRLVPVIANAMAAFANDGQLEDTTLMVITEFGRTVTQNGNGGTDHGQAFTAFVMGAGVRGGVYSTDFPDTFQPSTRRYDLPITTDYRKVIAEVATNRVGVQPNAISSVFPSYMGSNSAALGIAR